MSTDITEQLTTPWDLVVVGHGAAGLTAALAHLEAAAGRAVPPRVAVLDRFDEARRGGSTAWTTGIFRLDEDAQLAQDWGRIVRETAAEHADESYIEAFYDNATDALNWIRRHGVRVGRQPSAFPNNNGRYAWFLEGGGRALIDTLTPLVREAGGSTFYGATAERIERGDDGRISGLRVRTADGRSHLMPTRHLVLACGGFEANQEMLARYIPQAHALKAISPGTAANRGDGIRMAVEIGADTAGQFDGAHLEPVDPRSGNVEALVNNWLYGILVNRDGDRFLDEAGMPFDLMFDEVGNKVFREQGGLAYAISDAGARRRVAHFEHVNYTDQPPVTADTVEELAGKLGIDPAALRRTVDDFNSACRDGDFNASAYDGKATQGLKPAKSHWAMPLTEAPFEAWPVGAQICFTYGGLRVDSETRVLSVDGAPIPGLYAAGEITGVFYARYPAGTSVLRSITFGRMAGAVTAQAVAPPAALAA